MAESRIAVDPDDYDCRGGVFGCFVWAGAFVVSLVLGAATVAVILRGICGG